jgi:ATP-dependent DNA helicase RecG
MTRNPVIASMLHRISYIEKMGTGITRMKKAYREAGIEPPEFIITGFFTVLFWRHKPTDVGKGVGKAEPHNYSTTQVTHP